MSVVLLPVVLVTGGDAAEGDAAEGMNMEVRVNYFLSWLNDLTHKEPEYAFHWMAERVVVDLFL